LLKGQPGFSCRFSKSPDSAMKPASISIKANTLYADTKSLFCDRFTYDFSGFFIAGMGQLVT
jgi:hypothetical protein